MSKTDRLLGKPMDFEIGGELWTIHPLGIEKVELVLDLDNVDKRIPAMIKLVRDIIKESDPEATDEKINKIGIKYFKDFKDAIEVVNGLVEKDVNKGQIKQA